METLWFRCFIFLRACAKGLAFFWFNRGVASPPLGIRRLACKQLALKTALGMWAHPSLFKSSSFLSLPLDVSTALPDTFMRKEVFCLQFKREQNRRCASHPRVCLLHAASSSMSYNSASSLLPSPRKTRGRLTACLNLPFLLYRRRVFFFPLAPGRKERKKDRQAACTDRGQSANRRSWRGERHFLLACAVFVLFLDLYEFLLLSLLLSCTPPSSSLPPVSFSLSLLSF